MLSSGVRVCANLHEVDILLHCGRYVPDAATELSAARYQPTVQRCLIALGASCAGNPGQLKTERIGVLLGEQGSQRYLP